MASYFDVVGVPVFSRIVSEKAKEERKEERVVKKVEVKQSAKVVDEYVCFDLPNRVNRCYPKINSSITAKPVGTINTVQQESRHVRLPMKD